MKKLWSKNKEFNKVVEAFETKGDLFMDQKLIPYDITGSIAHAKMLLKIGLLTKKEYVILEKGLQEILALYKKGQFVLTLGDEDMHTKIENYLTQHHGVTGKKIHTARSRNDQVLTALRLFTKERLELIQAEILILMKLLHDFKKQYGDIAMPGYTHMQKAMPSSLGLWAESFIDSLKDDGMVLSTAYILNDQSPLGSAAGYGLPLPIDRAYTADLMGFFKVQKNPLYCQNSRGKIEGVVIASLISVMQTVNKFATDMVIFTTHEFGYFTVADAITTGSSIMPQKRNVDIAELLRSKVHLLLGNYTQTISTTANLMSGYNRDFQDIKKPLVESLEITLESLKACQILLQHCKPNKEALKLAMTEELYATQKALELVQKGKPFRDAYQQIGKNYEKK